MQPQEETGLGAKKINDELYALNSVLFIETNPIPIKAAMYLAVKSHEIERRLSYCGLRLLMTI